MDFSTIEDEEPGVEGSSVESHVFNNVLGYVYTNPWRAPIRTNSDCPLQSFLKDDHQCVQWLSYGPEPLVKGARY